MDAAFRNRFIELWGTYFPGAELPITFYYTDDDRFREDLLPAKGHTCLIGQLAMVRKGRTLSFDKDSIGCGGGKRYLGFDTETTPEFAYFLSCGIPGKLEGERYKKTPEIVREMWAKAERLEAPGKYAVFKRWDKLEEGDAPAVVIFFAEADVLSGLFTLANFEESEVNGVIAPFGAGCGTICQHPYLEKDKERPRGVLGMFDVSARPFVAGEVLTFAAPMKKFERMVEDMEESFLITRSWQKVQRRISRGEKKGEE